MQILDALTYRGGAARWDELRASGATSAQIRTALRHGLITRLDRGLFAAQGAPPWAIAAARHRAHLTCTTAFQQWGLPLLSAPSATHLAVPLDRHVRHARADVHVHRGNWVAERNSTTVRQVTPASALEHATRCLSPRELLAVTDAARAKGLVTREELVFTGRRARRWGEWLRERSDARAESMLESFARLELVEAGFRVQPQVWLPGAGRVDFLVNGAVVVETDGRDFHLRDEDFVKDRRRDVALQLLGLDVLRFAYVDVVHGDGTIAEAVSRALEIRRSTGAPWPMLRQPA